MSNADLSEEDKKRIKNADFYYQAKRVMRSHEDYVHVNIGEVYSIAYKNGSDEPVFISRGKSKDKFMVIEKDEGFIFAKRINSDGRLSKDVICLTIRFPQPDYQIQLDANQADAIIFQDEASFDPFKEGKDLSKKKNKARKLNKSKVLQYDTTEKAFAFVSNLKVGDTLFDSGTAFGEGIVEWRVSSIDRRDTDKTPQRDWSGQVYTYGRTDIDQKHYKSGLNELVSVEISVVGELPNSRRWVSKTRTVCFVDFICEKKYRDYYSSRPVTIDEV